LYRCSQKTLDPDHELLNIDPRVPETCRCTRDTSATARRRNVVPGGALNDRNWGSKTTEYLDFSLTVQPDTKWL
jgi:hypothetical protein